VLVTVDTAVEVTELVIVVVKEVVAECEALEVPVEVNVDVAVEVRVVEPDDVAVEVTVVYRQLENAPETCNSIAALSTVATSLQSANVFANNKRANPWQMTTSS
jgi:hypothetical protein